MAARGRKCFSDVDDVVRNVDAQLRCVHCREYFNADSRRPRFLVCFHSICESCVPCLLSKWNRVICRSCGRGTELPSGNVEDLQPNEYAYGQLLFLSRTNLRGHLRMMDLPKLLSSLRSDVEAWSPFTDDLDSDGEGDGLVGGNVGSLDVGASVGAAIGGDGGGTEEPGVGILDPSGAPEVGTIRVTPPLPSPSPQPTGSPRPEKKDIFGNRRPYTEQLLFWADVKAEMESSDDPPGIRRQKRINGRNRSCFEQPSLWRTSEVSYMNSTNKYDRF